MSYLRFVADPKMSQLVNQFKVPQLQNSLNQKLGAKTFVRQHIREKSEPLRILLNKAGVQKQKQELECISTSKSVHEDQVISSSVPKDLKQQLGIRDDVIQVSNFDVHFQKVGEKLGLYMERFNEYKAKQDYLKQTLLAQKKKKFENILIDPNFQSEDILREVSREYPIVMSLPKDLKQLQQQIQSRNQKSERLKTQHHDRDCLDRDSVVQTNNLNPNLSVIGLNSKRACSQPEEPRVIYTRGNFFQSRSPEEDKSTSVTDDFQNILFVNKQNKIQTAGINKRTQIFSFNSPTEQLNKQKSRTRQKNNGDSVSHKANSKFSPRSNIPQLSSVNGIQIFKGEALIKMSPKTSESIPAPPTLTIISPISSGQEMKIEINPDNSRRPVVKHVSGTLLNTNAVNTDFNGTLRTMLLPKIEIIQTTDRSNNEIGERWAPPNPDSIIGLQNLKNSETGLKSVVFSTSLKSMNSQGQVSPEANTEGMRNIRLLNQNSLNIDVFKADGSPTKELKYFVQLTNKDIGIDLNSGSTSKTESKISEVGEQNYYIVHKFSETPETGKPTLLVKPISIEDNVNNSATQFQEHFTHIQKTLEQELIQNQKQAEYVPAKTQEFIIRNYQNTPKVRSRDSQSQKSTPQQAVMISSRGEYLITRYIRPRGLSRGENSTRRGTSYNSKPNTQRVADDQVNGDIPSSEDESKIKDQTDLNQDQAASSFRGVRGKKTNPAQKFHYSLAMQSKKIKERSKAGRADCKLTNNFLEELSIMPMKTYERATANKSQTSQKSNFEEVGNQLYEDESQKKSPKQQTAKFRQEIKEPQTTKIVMTALRETSDSDQNNESINRDLFEVRQINKKIKKISVTAKNQRSSSPKKQPLPVNLVNLVLDENKIPENKISNVQQLIMRKRQIIREQHIFHQIQKIQRQIESNQDDVAKRNKAPFQQRDQVTMGLQTSSRFFDPIPSDRLGEQSLDLSLELRDIIELRIKGNSDPNSNSPSNGEHSVIQENLNFSLANQFIPIHNKLQKQRPVKTKIDVNLQMKETSNNPNTAENIRTDENSKVYLCIDQGLETNKNQYLSNFSLKTLKDQIRITNNPSVQNDQTKQRFIQTGRGQKNETHQMTMTSVASADQKQQTNKQNLFISNQMKSYSHIQNLQNNEIFKPNLGISSQQENVKILKTTRKSVFDQINAKKDVKYSNMNLINKTPLSKIAKQSIKNDFKSSVDSINEDNNRSFLYGTQLSRKYSKINSELASDGQKTNALDQANRAIENISTLQNESILKVPEIEINVQQFLQPENTVLDDENSLEDATSESQAQENYEHQQIDAPSYDNTMIHLILPDQQLKPTVIKNLWQEELKKKATSVQKSNYTIKIEQNNRSPLLKPPNYALSKKHRKLQFGAEDVWVLRKMEQQRIQNRNI